MVDLDPQGNATSGLGIDKTNIAAGTYDALLEDTAIGSLMISTPIENLSLIPANADLTGAEVELVSVMAREFKLQKALAEARNNFDWIFIDCPPSLGLLTVNALCAADSVLIPVQCEYYALEGLSQLVNTIELVRSNLNAALKIEGILLTMADYRTNLTSEVINETRNHFKDRVYQTIIPRSIRLTEAPGFGKPIALYDKNSLGARRYCELANELMGIKPEAELPNSHIINRLQQEISPELEVSAPDISTADNLPREN